MVCRKCGTEIAAKAIICYKCGTARAEPRATGGNEIGTRFRKTSPDLVSTGGLASGRARWIIITVLAAAAAVAWWWFRTP